MIFQTDKGELLQHYDVLADQYLDEMVNGRYFSFFHIKQMMDRAHRRNPTLTPCGASVGYVAISADGKIYPCFKFVGKSEYLMGDVHTGIKNNAIKEIFSNAHVRNKSRCMSCWARYLCGGGCHAHAVEYNNNILVPHEVECEMMKRRIELGVYLYTALMDKNPSMHKGLYETPAIQ